ncbi:MAG: cytochrome b/b6 domain-containing protein [Halieaceae bacterium]|jgi:cytochrome b|nr:cytochrome b/b6 domain-containing protein [Halieaceae bacterium]
MSEKIYVWDRFVRFFHWSLVGLFAFSYFTGEEDTTLHSYSGYAIVALLVARIAWGFMGSHYARFGEFLRRPSEVLAYAREYLGGEPKRYLGHNPLGASMTLALLLSLAATTVSGMQLLAVEEGKGLFAAVPPTTLSVIPAAAADDDEPHGSGGEDREEFWEEVHELAVNLTIALIVLHVLGVILSSLKHRESLVGAMLTGYKRDKP